jgi:hypothetical protein
MLQPYDFPPGIYANGTDLEAEGRWRDGNLVRWYNGHLRPIGGWQRFTASSLPGTPRSLFTWRQNDATPRLAIGTEAHLYIHDGSLAYDITPSGLVAGSTDGNYGLGFGAGNYGAQAYGVERSATGLSLDATMWDLDSWGQDLIALSNADGRIWHWVAPATGTAAVIVNSGAPTQNRGMFVSDERFLVALGANGDPRNITWCSQEDFTQWTASDTNSAGSLQLQTNGQVMNARKMPGEALIFTDTDVHQFHYIGAPYIYSLRRVGSNCGLIGRKAHIANNSICVWMGTKNFYIYDGATVQTLPCDIQEYVYNNLNLAQGSKVVAGVNALFNEFWWLYPSAGSQENDTIAIWNFRENWWSYAKLSRVSWVDKEVWPYPMAGDASGNLYQHEDGWTASNASRVGTIYATTGPFDIGGGDRLFDVNQLIPDTNVAGLSSLTFSFVTKLTPNDPYPITSGPFADIRGDGYIDVRLTGRQANMTIRNAVDGLFQVGVYRLDIAPTPGGRR